MRRASKRLTPMRLFLSLLMHATIFAFNTAVAVFALLLYATTP